MPSIEPQSSQDKRENGQKIASLGPGKTRTHCGGNIVSCDVACPWQNEATLLPAARTQEMFLKIFRNIFCVQDTKFVSVTNVARVAKRVNIWETWSRQQCCSHNLGLFIRGKISRELLVWTPQKAFCTSRVRINGSVCGLTKPRIV